MTATLKSNKIIIIIALAGLATMAIVFVVLVSSSGVESDITGKYYYESRFAFELGPDGNYIMGEGEYAEIAGTYTISGNKIIIKVDSEDYELEGIIEDGSITIYGDVFVKR